MKVCVIGNCQIAVLRPILAAMHGDLDMPSLPAVHTLQDQHRHVVDEATRDADWIIAQLVAPQYPVDYVTTETLRRVHGDRLIVWPNLYFSGYAPEYNTLGHTKYGNFHGPLLDYHSDKILIGFMLGWSVERTISFLRKPSAIDESWYGDAVARNIVELKRRERETDIVISDFIERHFITKRLFHILNHPTGFVVEELAARILTKIGVKVRNRVPSYLFSDLELLSAWHPENPYMRQKHGFEFPASRLYKGVRLVKADTPLGVKPAGPKIYNEQEMVEAMYVFYKPHVAVLRDHLRVKKVLDRYEQFA